MPTPTKLEKPVALDFQSLEPIQKPRKTWGPIPSAYPTVNFPSQKTPALPNANPTSNFL